jgi:predicted nuclease with TOPRIM domain
VESGFENMTKEEIIEKYNQLQNQTKELQNQTKELQGQAKELQSQAENLQIHKSQLQTNNTNFQTNNTQLHIDKTQLEFQLKELRRLVFGTKRERFILENNPHQQSLPFEEYQEIPSDKTVKETVTFNRNKKRPNHHGRIALPDHLPVEQNHYRASQ